MQPKALFAEPSSIKQATGNEQVSLGKKEHMSMELCHLAFTFYFTLYFTFSSPEFLKNTREEEENFFLLILMIGFKKLYGNLDNYYGRNVRGRHNIWLTKTNAVYSYRLKTVHHDLNNNRQCCEVFVFFKSWCFCQSAQRHIQRFQLMLALDCV